MKLTFWHPPRAPKTQGEQASKSEPRGVNARRRLRVPWLRTRAGHRATGTHEKLLIVGNGMAGFKLCERLVAMGATRKFRISVFGEEPLPAYDRVHLTSLLEGYPGEKLLLAPREWYERNDIELHTGEPIVTVNREERIARTAGGREERYDRLVLATGSRAFRPAMEGHDLPGVFVYRTLRDLERIKQSVNGCARAAVLGGGLLGLEIARALQKLNLDVWIVERGTSLMARQLDPQAGELLKTHVEKLGLHVCIQREAQRIEPLDKDLLLPFNTGECLRAQLVVIAAGIRPRDELAAACGLRLGPRGGIEVSDTLQSSDPNVFAIGECASHHGTLYGIVSPGYQMASALASRLMGKRERYRGSDQSTCLKLPGLSVTTLGDFQANGESLVSRDRERYRRLTLKNGRLVGATSVGEWPEQARVQEAIERRRRIWRWEQSRFLRNGFLWSEKNILSVSEWPAGAIICNCMGIRRAALSAARANGCTTVEQLSRETGASTVCGSCRPLLGELVGAPAASHRSAGLRFVLWASLVALVCALVIPISSPIPFLDTVQTDFNIDALWRNGLLKQITGFTLMGFALLGLVFSLRKRVKRFQWGEVSAWRAVHAALGTLALITLVTHTGFRLGQNLNFVLMSNFLALTLLGALAGAVTALERSLPGLTARRLRAAWTWSHIVLAWPLPALVLFHVLAVYYF